MGSRSLSLSRPVALGQNLSQNRSPRQRLSLQRRLHQQNCAFRRLRRRVHRLHLLCRYGPFAARLYLLTALSQLHCQRHQKPAEALGNCLARCRSLCHYWVRLLLQLEILYLRCRYRRRIR